MSKNYLEQIKALQAQNKWNEIADLFNLNENMTWFQQNLSEQEMCTLLFCVVQHINFQLKELNEHNDAENTLKIIIRDYNFIMRAAESYSYAKQIYNPAAYTNLLFASNAGNQINRVIKNQTGSISKDCRAKCMSIFNNRHTISNALKYYAVLKEHNPDDIKILYRYAKAITLVSEFSVRVADLEFAQDNDWILNRYKRFEKAKSLLSRAVYLYHQTEEEQQKQRTWKEYIKSEFNLVKLLNDYYKSYFPLQNIYKTIADRDSLIRPWGNIRKIQDDIITMNHTMKNILKELNLPEKRLNQKEVEQIAKSELPVKVFDIYYRIGRVHTLLANCSVSGLPATYNRPIDEAMAKFIENLEHAVDMFANVADVKLERKRANCHDTGGFVYELSQMGYCYSILGIGDLRYNKKLNELIEQYSQRKSFNAKKLTEELMYYKALSKIYDKHTGNKKDAITLLESLAKSTITINKKRAIKLLEELKTGKLSC